MFLHARWITLPPSWKLQDVQAALNVTIAFLCAASVFVLVRSFWVLAARKVTKSKDVPAHSLLSLNTVGETIDVVWLLRVELLTQRYRSLLVQCIFVCLLTVCTLFSGFIARFSTRTAITIVPRLVEGSLASRDTNSLLYDTLDLSAVFDGLKAAKFPNTKLAEFWPDPNSDWQYNDDQWNSSWTMRCAFNDSTPVVSTSIVTNNCTNGLWQQWPWIYDYWSDWMAENETNPYYDIGSNWVTWNANSTLARDMLIFSHGMRWGEFEMYDNQSLVHTMTVRTVAIHLHSIPINSSDEICPLVEGPIETASFTGFTCDLNRNWGNHTKDDLVTWGSSPDRGDVGRIARSYSQYYAGRLRRQSDAEKPITVISGPELATMYQAYLVTKDTSGTLFYNITSPSKPRGKRTIDVQVYAPQVNLICINVCAVVLVLVLLGLVNYWFFVLLNLKHLSRAPQSKLDWMLQTLRHDNDKDGPTKTRHKLRMSISSVDLHGDAVPLTRVESPELRRKKSSSTTITSIQEWENDSFVNTPATVASDFTGDVKSPRRSMWSSSPTQYNSQLASYQGLGLSSRHNYDRVPSSTDPFNSQQYDTAYDPGKKWLG